MPIPGGEAKCENQNCGHPRRVHSKNGCEDFDLSTNKPCRCKKTYMDMRNQ